MTELKKEIKNRKNRKNQRGQTMTEYAIIVALIALVCVGAVKFIGEQSQTTLNNMGEALQEANDNYDGGE